MSQIRFVPPEDWNQLPVQPTAGRWYLRLRPIMISMLVTLGIIVVMAFALSGHRSIVWIIVIPGIVLGVLGIAGIIMSILAAKPYRDERRLGYTTWPQAKARRAR